MNAAHASARNHDADLDDSDGGAKARDGDAHVLVEASTAHWRPA